MRSKVGVVHNYLGLPRTELSLVSPLLHPFHVNISDLIHTISAEHMIDTPSMMFFNLISSARILATVHENLARVTRHCPLPCHIWPARLVGEVALYTVFLVVSTRMGECLRH